MINGNSESSPFKVELKRIWVFDPLAGLIFALAIIFMLFAAGLSVFQLLMSGSESSYVGGLVASGVVTLVFAGNVIYLWVIFRQARQYTQRKAAEFSLWAKENYELDVAAVEAEILLKDLSQSKGTINSKGLRAVDGQVKRVAIVPVSDNEEDEYVIQEFPKGLR